MLSHLLQVAVVLIVLQASVTYALPQAQIVQNQSNATFFNPLDRGGRFFAAFDPADSGPGEPLNVIISGTSSPQVLTDDGVLHFARAIGFSNDCISFGSNGSPQVANLGDGNGPQPAVFELREDFGNVGTGVCIEQLIGGNHFRVYRQNGTLADSGALFLAVSSELNVLHNHTISADGYNRGRDFLVQGAVGQKSFNGTIFSTVAQNLTGVMPSGSNNVNHNISVDGNAVLLTVTIM
ncbi:hypothetical protein BC835DRAFT_458965 [Cytidiella melzeri]|nr:hypothetical protein BC835DRAFT_458965 [Cytidiella melzeri]